jgi:hypothetical protein
LILRFGGRDRGRRKDMKSRDKEKCGRLSNGREREVYFLILKYTTEEDDRRRGGRLSKREG